MHRIVITFSFFFSKVVGVLVLDRYGEHRKERVVKLGFSRFSLSLLDDDDAFQLSVRLDPAAVVDGMSKASSRRRKD